MSICLVGSNAINSQLKGFRNSDVNDFDIFYSANSTNVLELVKSLSSLRIDSHEIPEYLIKGLLDGSDSNIPTLNNLYTLKLSHVFWPIHHEKTIRDIIYMSDMGCEVNKKLFHALKSYWSEVHGGKNFLSLNKSKDEFFDNAVEEIVEHDLIHEWVSKYDRPLYTKCLKDGESVLLDWNKFNLLSREDKIHMIREEIMVIGIERFALKKEFDIQSGVCYNKALRLVITRLMKGKFANFMAFNLSEIARYNMRKEHLKAKEFYLGGEY